MYLNLNNKGEISSLQTLDNKIIEGDFFVDCTGFKRVLMSKLGAKFDTKSVGLFVWAKLPKGVVDSETFIDKILQKQNVFITPGTIFGSKGEGYIRFSLCASTEVLEEAIARVK